MTESGFDVEAVLAAMTVEEKVTLLSGVGRWQTHAHPRHGVPAVWMSDGPHGVRRETDVDVSLPATSFPTGSSLGSTWDRELVARVAAAIAREASAQQVHVMLGPGINMKRTPLCGRNFEYFSEDPVHTGEIAAAYVRGMQSRGVGATVKHLAANNQENGRHWTSSEVDERTLREIYLAAFERVVTSEQPWMVMSSYNRINGIHASQHRWLLTEILREEWGFDGVVVSDWVSVHDPVAALDAGLDIQMPGVDGATDAVVVAAVDSGDVAMSVLDGAARRVLRLVAAAATSSADASPLTEAEERAHADLAREAAVAGMVLLRNEGDLLPLDAATTGRVAIIGRYAAEPRIQGGGSARVNARASESALDHLVAELGDRVAYAEGFAEAGHPVDAGLRAQARDLAAACVIAVVFVGLPDLVESEGYDRTDLDLPADQVALLEAVTSTGTPTVVVLTSGSAVALGSWHDAGAAVLQAWLAGQSGGAAVVDVLLGRAEPGGRLGETFPVRLADTPALLSTNDRGSIRYGEGVFVGYRWYDARELPVRYPFGHGLTYTSFDYRDLRVTTMDARTGAVTVSLVVRNTGARAGREVVQLYVEPSPSPVLRPVRELKGFRTVRLEPGAEAEISFDLGDRDFAYYDVSVGGWVRAAGTARVVVGRSSRDLRVGSDVEVVVAPDAEQVPTDAELEILTLAWSAAESERRRIR